MTDAIAIDFGTSRTKAAYWDAKAGRVELMRLGADDRAFIPSSVCLPAGSERIVWGVDAEELLAEDPAAVVDVLKRKLRQPFIRTGLRKETPQRLLTELFRWVRTHAATVPALGQRAPVAVTITRPALFGPVEEKLLEQAARAAGFERVSMVPEPVAAARAWLREAGGAADEVVVFDGGGGTIDWAYLRRDGQDFRVVTECPPGGWHVGGHDIDEELAALAEEKAGGGGTDQGDALRPALLRAVRIQKENFSRGLPIRPVRVGRRPVQLEADEIAATIEHVFVSQACANLARFLHQVKNVSGDGLPPVLLVGGASHLKGLKEALETRLGCRCINWERSDYAIVLGAVTPPRAAPQRLVDVISGTWSQPGCVFRDRARDGRPDPALPEMVVIPSGTFLMGSPETEPERYEDEGPQHQVTIARPFALGRYAMTQAEWTAVMGANPSHFKGDRLPVESVSWDDAQEFIEKLNERWWPRHRGGLPPAQRGGMGVCLPRRHHHPVLVGRDYFHRSG